jgi:hypothetical protein
VCVAASRVLVHEKQHDEQGSVGTHVHLSASARLADKKRGERFSGGS